jgi:hypothetical protein
MKWLLIKIWILDHFEFWRLKPKYLFIKDPCKKCLVQPKCEKICLEKHKYRSFQGPFTSVLFAKCYLALIYVMIILWFSFILSTYF